MKKFFYLTAGSIIVLVMSCTDSNKPATETAASPEQSQAEKNKEVNKAIIRAIEKGDSAAIDTLIASDAVDHAGPNMTEVKGDSLKKMLSSFNKSVDGLKFDMVQDAAEGDYVFALSKMSGTTTANPGMGMPPNTKMDMTGVDVVKFRDGKAVEHWSYMDPKDMMKMMPPSGKMESKMKDTTMKK